MEKKDLPTHQFKEYLIKRYLKAKSDKKKYDDNFNIRAHAVGEMSALEDALREYCELFSLEYEAPWTYEEDA